MDPRARAELEAVALATHLREGAEGVAQVLWNLCQTGSCPLHELAARVGLPIPVLAAVRRELEKAGLLVRSVGLALSPRGLELAEALWGSAEVPELRCPTCAGRGLVLPERIAGVLEGFRSLCDQRPAVDVALDQAHGTPETGLVRAALLLQAGALLGGTVAFLGDDDLTSLACALVAQEVGAADHYRGLVVDIDTRYLDLIDRIAAERNWHVRTHAHDYQSALPRALHGTAAAVVTDPPYTHAGLAAVLARAVELLDPQRGGLLLLAFAPQGPNVWLACQALLVQYGMALESIYTGANQYVGNTVHANRSNLYLCRHVRSGASRHPSKQAGFYTAERHRK